MTQQDEFKAKALDLAMGRYPSGLRSLVPQHERIADALRAEHTRGQIEALEACERKLNSYVCLDDWLAARIAELRKAGT